MATIKVIVADDHAVVRTGLQLYFQASGNIELTDEVDNGYDLLKKIRENDYDVAVIDIHMPGREILDTVRDIKIFKPGIQIIVFTMNPEQNYFYRLIKAGVSAYIGKNNPPEVLVSAIQTVAKGKKFFTPGQSEMLMDYLTSEDTGSHDALTDREFQILRLIAKGQSKDEIAASLLISKNTISNHRNSILRKLKLSNNADITRYAIKNGLVDQLQ